MLKRGDRRVRIFSAHNNWWVSPEVSLPLPYQRSANVFLNFLRQGVKIMHYCKNMHSKSLKCAKKDRIRYRKVLKHCANIRVVMKCFMSH